MSQRQRAMRKIGRVVYFVLGIIFSIASLYCCDSRPEGFRFLKDKKSILASGRAYNYADIAVRRVIDGDTLELENSERLRLIGIDTPEMHESQKLYRDSRRTRQDLRTIQALGRRAYAFTKKLIEGKRVSLEFDLQRQDRYKRLLAYVYLKDGTFVNAEIIKQGYASVMTVPPNVKYADLFLGLYQEARNNKRGLWQN